MRPALHALVRAGLARAAHARLSLSASVRGSFPLNRPIGQALDLAAGLTQVLADGTFTYLYGNGRIAQATVTQTAYFLGDALGSVRHLVDANGQVTLARSYEPYGDVLTSASGREIERGAPYLELSERTPMDSPFVSPAAQTNRAAITALMARHGFVTYPWEFWHYNSGDAYESLLRSTDTPARYGPVDLELSTGQVQPMMSPLEDLNSLADIQRLLELAQQRSETNRPKS